MSNLSEHIKSFFEWLWIFLLSFALIGAAFIPSAAESACCLLIPGLLVLLAAVFSGQGKILLPGIPALFCALTIILFLMAFVDTVSPGLFQPNHRNSEIHQWRWHIITHTGTLGLFTGGIAMVFMGGYWMLFNSSDTFRRVSKVTVEDILANVDN